MSKTVTKDMLISEIISIDAGNIAILMASGMHCATCPASQMETLEEACQVHGMDVNDVIEEINDYLKAKETM